MIIKPIVFMRRIIDHDSGTIRFFHIFINRFADVSFMMYLCDSIASS
jgi:hypothetical protein